MGAGGSPLRIQDCARVLAGHDSGDVVRGCVDDAALLRIGRTDVARVSRVAFRPEDTAFQCKCPDRDNVGERGDRAVPYGTAPAGAAYFDPLFYGYGWSRQGIFPFCVLLPAVLVLAYVVLAGLAGTIANQALQFVAIMAGFLLMVMMGLKNIGGWSGLQAALPGVLRQDPNALGNHSVGLALLVGFVLTAGHWMTDFRVLQMAMAAKNVESSRRIPVMASAVKLLLSFVFILPGAIAIVLPTPQSTTTIRNENGAIFHEITVVPREAGEGRGLVPARVDPVTLNPMVDGAGRSLLNYDRATPEMLMHFPPMGLLGLGLAALFASLMSSIAASVTAINSVFVYDIYRTCIRKTADDRHFLVVARWTAAGAALLVAGVALALSAVDGGATVYAFAALLLVFTLVSSPQLATFLLGMFWNRTTGHGAFAGLVAGTGVAILHYGLTLPIGANPGFLGGWMGVVHRYPSFVTQCVGTAILGFGMNLIVATAVSLCTQGRAEKELKGLVRSLALAPAKVARWKRPEAMAAVVLLAAVIMALVFA